MLIAVIGDFGSGKTLFLTMVAVSSKREIMSNFRLELPNYSHLDVMDLIDLGDNKEILLDEAYTWLESRVSGSFLNRYISYIIFQSRHRSLDIYTTEQLFHTVDIRFRDLVHKIVSCSRVSNGKQKEFWDFRYDILNVYDETTKIFILPYEKALEYFPLYDTLEIIKPFSQEALEINILKNNPKELYKKIKEIALDIKEKVKKITHASVKIGLLKSGYNLEYESLVYSCLKDFEEQED